MASKIDLLVRSVSSSEELGGAADLLFDNEDPSCVGEVNLLDGAGVRHEVVAVVARVIAKNRAISHGESQGTGKESF